MSVLRLHNEANGVIVAMKCFDSHGEPLVPGNVEYCRKHQARYDAFDYEHLMNTTFALVPGGRSPATFRLGEVNVLGIARLGGAGCMLTIHKKSDTPR